MFLIRDFDKAIADAEKTATKMGDDYVSVEHLMLESYSKSRQQG